MRDEIAGIDDRILAHKPRPPEEGFIVSIGGKVARVQVKGSTAFKYVSVDNAPGVEVGKRCLIQWIPLSKKYVMLTVFASSALTDAVPQRTFELFPPSNFSLNTPITNIIMATWDTPPQQAVVFEVQTNSSASDSGATTVLKTRGGQALIYATTTTYVRVRSISADFHYSAWSDWLSETPIVIGLDAADISYIPTTDGDWPEGVPDDIAEALDTLAARGAGTGSASGVITIQNYADTRPADPVDGNMVILRDGVRNEIYDGGWKPFFEPWIMTEPVLGDYTWANQGSTTTDTSRGGIFMRSPAAGGDVIHVLYKSAPTPPYTITMAFIPMIVAANYVQSGLVFRSSSGGVITFSFAQGNFKVERWNNETSFNAQSSNLSPAGAVGTVVWLRIEDDNTDRKFYWLPDGRNALLIYTESRTSFITPDQIGFYTTPSGSGLDSGLTVLSLEQG